MKSTFARNALIFICLIPSVSRATLGKDRASVDADVAALSAAKLSIPKGTQLPTGIEVDAMIVKGTTIKQYSDTTGTIFVIGWQGIKPPNWRVLLGTYFAGYAKADAKHPKGRRFVREPIVSSAVTLSQGGVAFNLYGLAILNGKVPAGVNPEELP